MKKLFAFLLPLLWITKADGQDTSCAFNHILDLQQAQDSQFLQKRDAHYYRLQQFRKDRPDLNLYPASIPPNCGNCLVASPGCFKAKYVIPVVVTVVHLPAHNTVGTGSNISNAQIQDQISRLNDIFANWLGTGKVNTGIQFCIIPNGIYRVPHAKSNHDWDDMGGLMALKDPNLPFENFMHIFVVSDITDKLGKSLGVSGYATYPGGNPQGIVMKYRKFGIPGNNVDAGVEGKILAHEVGHYLGLLHPHDKPCEGTNITDCATSGDYCCDVPPTAAGNSGCPIYSPNSCFETYGDLPDQIENYMDYTWDACRTTFTYNQTEIMHYTLESLRARLIDAEHINNLALTCCAFSAHFSARDNFICSNGTASFVAYQYTGQSPKYRWILKRNGITIKDTAITSTHLWSYPFSSLGSYDLTLEVILGGDTARKTIPGAVIVKNCGTPMASDQGNWYFGDYAGLKFHTGAVIPALEAISANPPTIYTGEGTVSISDANGRLLFYGGGRDMNEGVDFFTQAHNRALINGYVTTLPFLGSGSGAQGLLAIPNPSNQSQYLIFQASGEKGTGGLYYSVFDTTITTEGAFVDTTQVDIPFPVLSGSDSSTTIRFGTIRNTETHAPKIAEMITAIPKCNSTDYWLLVKDASDLSFPNGTDILVYSVDNGTGITFHSQYKTNNTQTQGYMKVSPDGNLVAVANQVLNFNRTTGILTHRFTFPFRSNHPFERNVYGLSFSPNSKILYYIQQAYFAEENIYQMNLELDSPYVYKQKVAAFPSGYFQAMQLGPDNKLYISKLDATDLAVIELPDVLCSGSEPNACKYKEVGPSLQVGSNGGACNSGLPNMIDAKKSPDVIKEIKAIITNCNTVSFASTFCCDSVYYWDFGDGNTSTDKEPVHTYSATGTYTVTLLVGFSQSVQREINLGINGVKVSGLTRLCDTSNAYNYVTTYLNDYATYNWTSPKATISTVPKQPYSAFAKWRDSGWIKLTVTDRATGCSAEDSLYVRMDVPIRNNTITKWRSCLPDTIKGSTPTGGTGPLYYSWMISNDSKSWSLLQGENQKDLLPPTVSTNKYYMRIVQTGNGVCNSRSNAVINVVNKVSEEKSNFFCSLQSYGTGMANDYSYQWQKSTDSMTWIDMTGYTSVDILSTSLGAGYYYFRRKATSYSNGCIWYSNVIKVPGDLVFTQEPSDVSLCYANHFFKMPGRVNVYTNATDPKYQWQKRSAGGAGWININSTEAYALSGYAWQYNDGDSIRCIASSTVCNRGPVYSKIGIIRKYAGPPSILTNPSNQTVIAGTDIFFRCVAANCIDPHYTWQQSYNNGKSWFDIANSHNDTLRIDDVNFCQKNQTYRAKISNGCTIVYSDTAHLTITGTTPLSYDLWMKDHWADIGNERYQAGIDIPTTSVDLWVRNKRDGVKPANIRQQEPLADLDTNYVYYTLRNRGLDTSRGGKLYLYWTWGATAESWPLHWTSNSKNVFHNAIDGKTYPMGGEINTVPITIPAIAPGDSLRAAFPWTKVPQPIHYYEMKDGKPDTFNRNMQTCILARIQTCDEAPYGMTYPEIVRLDTNVGSNNNIVSRNLRTKYLNPPPGTHEITTPILTRNPYDQTTTFNLCLTGATVTYMGKADVFIQMDDALLKAWKDGGLQGSGYVMVNDNTIRAYGSPLCLTNLQLPAGFMGFANVTFKYRDQNDRFTNEVFNFTIKQTTAAGQYEGQFDFIVTDHDPYFEYVEQSGDLVAPPKQTEESSAIDSSKSRKQRIAIRQEPEGSLKIYPNPAENTLTIEYTLIRESKTTISVADMYGKSIYQTHTNITQAGGHYKYQIDCSSWAPGVYNVQYIENGKPQTIKVIILK